MSVPTSRKTFPLLLAAVLAFASATALPGCGSTLFGDGSAEQDVDGGQAPALSESELETASSYDDETRAVVGLLAANRWVSEGSRQALTFDADANTVTDIAASEAEPISFVVESLTSVDGSYQMVVSIGGALHSAVLARGSAMEGASSDASLTVYGWNSSAVYLREPAQQDLKVTGTPAWLSSLGIETATVDAAVASYVRENHPSVTEAACSSSAAVDGDEDYVALSYTLNDSDSTSINVNCSLSQGTVLDVS